MDRPCVDLCADRFRDLRRAGTLPDDGGPLAGSRYESNRILEILLNYIVAPALLIYTAILYLYMAKILVTWSLPEGGVAYLVFGFTLFALAEKALQFLMRKRLYDWFFDRFSLISLPTQLLFWVGAIRRTSEYGLPRRVSTCLSAAV